MKKEGLLFFTDVHWTLVGLMIFFVLFVVMLILQTRQYKNEDIQQIEKLPIEGDEK